ncbi:alpha-2 collagen [Apostichopus japonicus]|uniref:Alpha-2 collagen n=1 Tax=Stichopus japonicus TaxID=307972 RepID=A0A2G8K2I1_STIJA|nr:alpha-2 collagen [Apostichopus japonicus]
MCWLAHFFLTCPKICPIQSKALPRAFSEQYSKYIRENNFMKKKEALSDRNPCSFRGTILLHKQAKKLDPCTDCVCFNGTTTCNIESCPAELGCESSKVIIIPEECCPQCPYKMLVADTHILLDESINFTIGDTAKIKFGLDIEVDRKLTSRTVRGENLWKLGAWMSPNEDGSGPKFSHNENVFTELDAAKEYSKPDYPPWDWQKLRHTLMFSGGTCDDFKYFCVEFGEADDPLPTYDLPFTMGPLYDEHERLVDCKPLGTCAGVNACVTEDVDCVGDVDDVDDVDGVDDVGDVEDVDDTTS